MSLKFEISVKSAESRLVAVLSRVNIGHILLAVFAVHLFLVAQPQDGMIFDEAHYVPAAVKTMQGIAANAEHTPLAKVLVGLSISVFGDYWFAWRMPIIVCGVATVYVAYLIAKRFMGETYALYAAAFLGFDTIFFVHSGIFVLDMPAILFALIGVELYFRGRFGWAGAAFGVGFLMKELALMILGGVVLYSVVMNWRRVRVCVRPASVFVCAALIVGGGGLWIYDAIYQPSIGGSTQAMVVVSPIVMIGDNTTYTTTSAVTTIVTDTSDRITNPVQHMWFSWRYFSGLAPNIVTDDANLRPAYGWVLPFDTFNAPHYLTVNVNGVITVDWKSQINPFVEYLFFPILIAGALRRDKFGKTLICWGTATYVPWFIFSLFVQRMTFNYYVLYTIPMMAFGASYLWESLPLPAEWKRRGIFIHLCASVGFFTAFLPVILIR